MNGTYLSTDPYDDFDEPYHGSNETSVFVDFTTSPARYTVQEIQDDRDHWSFW